jgi:hypothetical protein
MKIKKLIILLLIVSTGQAQNNLIIAGQHGSTDYYHNFIPDTIVISTDSVDYYPLDINNDGVIDFKFKLVAPSTGLGMNYYACTINALNNNTIAFGYSDSCWDINNIYLGEKEMIYAFDYNDTIDNNRNWSNYLYLNYVGWTVMKYSCFANYNYQTYIGVRVLMDSLYKYGWIKIDSMTFNTGPSPGPSTLIMGTYACENSIADINPISNIDNQIIIYPNPASTIIYIVLNKQNAIQNKNTTLKIIDLLGNIIKQKQLMVEKTDMDITDLQPGIYFAQTKTNEGILTKKIIIAR